MNVVVSDTRWPGIYADLVNQEVEDVLIVDYKTLETMSATGK